jgi:hypothetical protein
MGYIQRIKRLIRSELDTLDGFSTHATALEVRDRRPLIFKQYYTFAFVRNPFSWQVSLYHYMKQNKDHYQHELIENMTDFEEYIEWRVSEDKHLQSEFITDEKGNIIVDYVGKVENIEDDFNNICENIGLQANLPHKNASSHKHYEHYYNDKTRRLILKSFKKILSCSIIVTTLYIAEYTPVHCD